MPEEMDPHTIPVVFQVTGTGREQAAHLLHTLLTNWGEGINDVPVLDERGAVTHPVESWWFPEASLKHIDRNTHEAQHLREPHAFIDEYQDTPVMDLLAETFPEPPDPNEYRTPDGELDEDAYGIAFDQFTEQAMDLAINLTRIGELTSRLLRAEQIRNGLADLLERSPLPEEPHKDDYLVTVAPSYEGEIESARYRWDHTQWETDFKAAARERDGQLRSLLDDAGGPDPRLPARFHNEWAPRDLAAVQALRDLVAQEASGAPPRRLLSRETRAQLHAILHTADLDVRVEGPAGELYAGAASAAARVLPAGVYEATTLFGDAPVRRVVGPAGRDNALASAAFRPEEHNGATLDQIARTMQAVPDDQLRARLVEILQATGRSGDRIIQAKTPLEHGVLLSELLRQRGEHLTTEGPDAATPTGGSRGTEPEHPAR